MLGECIARKRAEEYVGDGDGSRDVYGVPDIPQYRYEPEEVLIRQERRMLHYKRRRVRLYFFDGLYAGNKHPDIWDCYGDRTEEEERVYHVLYHNILEPSAL